MIDDVRGLADRIAARREVIAATIAHLSDEDRRLVDLRASLEAFIEQPPAGQGDPPSTSPPAVSPTSVICPDCGDQVMAQGLGSHQRKHKPGYEPYERPSRSIAGPDGLIECPDCHERLKPQGIGTHRRMRHGLTGRAERPRAPLMSVCPDCDREVKTSGLGTHRRQAHGRRTTLVEHFAEPPADEAPAPPRRPAAESFLCERCSQSFPTREARDEHQATHPAPVEPRIVGRNPTTQRNPQTGMPI